MQISYFDNVSKKIKTVIFDIFSIFSKIESLGEKHHFYDNFLSKMLFENEKIVKIFHGGLGGDIGWLQRDFGVRCVNIFDT
jgi:ribonuclease D